MDRSGITWRLTVGLLGLLLCVWMIVAGIRDTRGDLGAMAAVGALFLSPLPASCVLSAAGIKYGWRPDIVYRTLPLVTALAYLSLMVAAYVFNF